ncbi:MAG: DNA gyrase/topoisomerase IV subunit B, partial [Promethearchaeota archaeon]
NGEKKGKENGEENGEESGINILENNTNVAIDEEYIGFQFELGTEGNVSGTRITFKPDNQIFRLINEEEEVFDFSIINKRLRNLAYLNPVLEIQLYDENTNKNDEHHYEGGIKEFVEYLNEHNKVLFDEPIYINKRLENVNVEIALQYTESYLENIITFVNNVNTLEGGTHLTGFKSSLTRIINNYVKSAKQIPKQFKDVKFLGNDVREGLTCILAVQVPEPQFEGQTKTKLGNEEVQTIVSNVMTDQFGKILEEHPRLAGKIFNKCMVAKNARLASKKARDLTRRKSALNAGRLPGKLADCSSNDASVCELFIVEGNSAGGSAKQGRNREFQAILPLRGKILNVEKARLQKVIQNKEIRSIISAVGTGIYTSEESDFKIDKIRYHKIIIACDADIDGAHIETLLLTYFFRYMRPLIDNGYLYMAVPPLFKVKYRNTSKYIYEEKNLAPYLQELRGKYKIGENTNIKVQRYKGLGEMNPEELWETTMDPQKRRLLKMKYSDFAESHQLFTTLMGNEVNPRKQYIMEHYKEVKNLDI